MSKKQEEQEEDEGRRRKRRFGSRCLSTFWLVKHSQWQERCVCVYVPGPFIVLISAHTGGEPVDGKEEVEEEAEEEEEEEEQQQQQQHQKQRWVCGIAAKGISEKRQ